MTRKLEWQAERQIAEEIARGPWGAWLTTSKKPKDLIKNETEVRLAARLGLPTVPKGSGVLSFGWVVSKLMIGTSGGVAMPQNDPMVQAMIQLGNDRRQLPGIARLVLHLMMHRECTTKHGHNCFHYHREDEGVRLYDDHWDVLSEEVLTWAMLQSPFADISTAGRDEWISEVHVQNGRLHSADGAALVTTMRRSLYALNGVTMSQDEFKLRGNAPAILRVQNVEARRVLVEDMGADRFIDESGLKPVHSDVTGKLYRLDDGRKESWNIRHLCWVHVVCPSTQHEYMLAVPPNTRTAREGVAWTFRKLPEEYQPGQET
jgi:hypothetical protein